MAGQIIDQFKGYTTALFDVSIRHALRGELSWTHYHFLMRVENSNATTPKGWKYEQIEDFVMSVNERIVRDEY